MRVRKEQKTTEMEKKTKKRERLVLKLEKREPELPERERKMSKRELFLKIMRELGKSEDILIRENGTRIRI